MKIDLSENSSSSHEQIAARAHELWQKSGSPGGRDLEFWLAAENELRRDRDEIAQTKNGESTPPRSTPEGIDTLSKRSDVPAGAKVGKPRSSKARS